MLEMTTARSAIKILRRFIIFRTAPLFRISNFSFKRGFQTESKGDPPRGLTLNLEPINLHTKSFDTRAVFAVQ